MSQPLVSQIKYVVWHDAREEKPKCCGPFLCVDTSGKIFTQKYFQKAKYPRWEKISRVVLFWGEVQIPAMPSEKDCRDWELNGRHEQRVAYWSMKMKGCDIK